MQQNPLLKRLHQGGCLIGMVHCQPLPGSLGFTGDIEALYARAVQDALALEQLGFSAILVENTCDMPYTDRIAPEQAAALAAIARQVVSSVNIPVGVNASFSDTAAALVIAHAVGASFVRAPVFVDTVQVTGLGVLTPCAPEAIRCRRRLQADSIAILADVQVKHSHLAGVPVPLEESAQAARDAGADAIVVTGVSTGQAASLDDVARVKKAAGLPVVIGSGFSPQNAAAQFAVADAAIVGSALKAGGDILGPIDPERGRVLMQAVGAARGAV